MERESIERERDRMERGKELLEMENERMERGKRKE